MGWMELRTILAKIHFSYDLTLVNQNVGWQRDSEMHTLWKKPKLHVRVTRRDPGSALYSSSLGSSADAVVAVDC